MSWNDVKLDRQVKVRVEWVGYVIINWDVTSLDLLFPRIFFVPFAQLQRLTHNSKTNQPNRTQLHKEIRY
mgnify:CR=1 FL=1